MVVVGMPARKSRVRRPGCPCRWKNPSVPYSGLGTWSSSLVALWEKQTGKQRILHPLWATGPPVARPPSPPQHGPTCPSGSAGRSDAPGEAVLLPHGVPGRGCADLPPPEPASPLPASCASSTGREQAAPSAPPGRRAGAVADRRPAAPPGRARPRRDRAAAPPGACPAASPQDTGPSLPGFRGAPPRWSGRRRPLRGSAAALWPGKRWESAGWRAVGRWGAATHRPAESAAAPTPGAEWGRRQDRAQAHLSGSIAARRLTGLHGDAKAGAGGPGRRAGERRRDRWLGEGEGEGSAGRAPSAVPGQRR